VIPVARKLWQEISWGSPAAWQRRFTMAPTSCRRIGRSGAHWVTIGAVAVAFALSVVVYLDVLNGNRFNGDQQTFPKLLQQAGYQTAVVGKWHLGTHQAPQGYDYSEVLIGQGPYYNPPMIRNGERVRHTGYTTHVITDLALAALDPRMRKSVLSGATA